MLNKILSQNPVFAHLSEGKRENLAGQAISRHYRVGQWIAYRGDEFSYLFIVENGEIQALKESSEGRSLMVVSLGPGEVFWGLAFFIEGAPMPVGLLANQESEIHMWSRDRLKPVFLQDGRMSWELTRLMIRRMQHASDILEEMAFTPVTGRLARLLMEQSAGKVGETLARDITLDEMAARIGTTREMVCRQLYRLADRGVIHINRTEFMVADREGLENLADLER